MRIFVATIYLCLLHSSTLGQNSELLSQVWNTQCLKITEKVSFNIGSAESNFYILSGQKFIKIPKIVNLAIFWKPEAY